MTPDIAPPLSSGPITSVDQVGVIPRTDSSRLRSALRAVLDRIANSDATPHHHDEYSSDDSASPPSSRHTRLRYGLGSVLSCLHLIQADIGVRKTSRQRALGKCPSDYEPQNLPLLPPPEKSCQNRPLLVLDLDETLVRSSFEPCDGADWVFPLTLDEPPTMAQMESEDEPELVYVRVRPGAQRFLEVVTRIFEVVIFTASVSEYADAVIDRLDPMRLVHHRLYREHCSVRANCYVKDLRNLGRPLARTIIVDNSPLCYSLQPENALPISTYADTKLGQDRQLDRVLTILEEAPALDDVRYAHF